jgi:hypothetical protein
VKAHLTRKRPTWILAALLILALFVQACAPAAEAPAAGSESAAESGGPVVNSLGRETARRRLRRWHSRCWFTPINNWKRVSPRSTSSPRSTNRADSISDILSDSLVRLDKNFPGAARRRHRVVGGTISGLVWTFKLDPNLMWERRHAGHRRRFTSPPSNSAPAPITPGTSPGTIRARSRNWDPGGETGKWRSIRSACARWMPTRWSFTTEAPAPFLPAMLVYSAPFPEGGARSPRPALQLETSRLLSPPALTSWWNGQRISAWSTKINPDYKGTKTSLIWRKLIVVGYGEGTHLAAFEANELDFVWGKPGHAVAG